MFLWEPTTEKLVDKLDKLLQWLFFVVLDRCRIKKSSNLNASSSSPLCTFCHRHFALFEHVIGARYVV